MIRTGSMGLDSHQTFVVGAKLVYDNRLPRATLDAVNADALVRQIRYDRNVLVDDVAITLHQCHFQVPRFVLPFDAGDALFANMFTDARTGRRELYVLLDVRVPDNVHLAHFQHVRLIKRFAYNKLFRIKLEIIKQFFTGRHARAYCGFVYRWRSSGANGAIVSSTLSNITSYE